MALSFQVRYRRLNWSFYHVITSIGQSGVAGNGRMVSGVLGSIREVFGLFSVGAGLHRVVQAQQDQSIDWFRVGLFMVNSQLCLVF
jgi:hypothetical protein